MVYSGCLYISLHMLQAFFISCGGGTPQKGEQNMKYLVFSVGTWDDSLVGNNIWINDRCKSSNDLRKMYAEELEYGV